MQISYYGRLDGPLLGLNLGGSLMDDLFKKMIQKNNEILSKNQKELLKEFKDEMRTILNQYFKRLNKALYDIESIFAEQKKATKKEKQNIKKKVKSNEQ